MAPLELRSAAGAGARPDPVPETIGLNTPFGEKVNAREAPSPCNDVFIEPVKFRIASPPVPLPKVHLFMAENLLTAVSGDFIILASIVTFPALPDFPEGIKKMGRNPAVQPAGQVP